MASPSRPPTRRLTALLPPLAVVLAFGALVWWIRGSTPPPREPPASAFGDDPLGRAAAAPQAPPALLLRLGVDEDWRVRAAASAALAPDAPAPPARDTPMAEREAWLLARLQNLPDGDPPPLCPSLAAAPHARYGAGLVAACLACHAPGPSPEPRFTDARCAECHAAEHAAFDGSAHANSLSHLRLPTVDPATRQVGLVDFGGRRGLSCVSCHEPEAPEGSPSGGCVASFRPTDRSCAACHAGATADHAAWSTSARPVRADWPPGSLGLVSPSSSPAPGCTDCHTDHRFAARRDPAFLASGLHAAFVREEADPGATVDGGLVLRLTNLAGHRNPAGTGRRALDVSVVLEGETFLLARLATLLPPGAEPPGPPLDPALAPGETRNFRLPAVFGPENAATLQLTYLRDRFDPEAYRVDVPVPTPRFPAPPRRWQPH